MPVVQRNGWNFCPMFSRTSCWRCCRSPVTSLSRMPASCSRYTATAQPQSALLTAHCSQRSLQPQHLQIVDGFSIALFSIPDFSGDAMHLSAASTRTLGYRQHSPTSTDCLLCSPARSAWGVLGWTVREHLINRHMHLDLPEQNHALCHCPAPPPPLILLGSSLSGRKYFLRDGA